jgi:hypothetical protein
MDAGTIVKLKHWRGLQALFSRNAAPVIEFGNRAFAKTVDA